MLPNLLLLEQISQKIQNLPNKQGESKRKAHYGLFLLGYKAGLRVSEAINFNLSTKSKRGLYLIKTKGKKTRLVYIPKQVIQKLKKSNWKPNNTNRFNFYHFLRKIKRELAIPNYVELTPHTLRRAFATYHAENGLPLPLLQKLLGHQSIRTTALYWRNIYNDGGDDTSDILTGKAWLEKPPKPQPKPATTVKISLELPELLIPNSLVSKPQPNYLNKIQQLESQLSQFQQENNTLKKQNIALQKDLTELSKQNKVLKSDLADSNQQNTILHQEKSQAITENEKIKQDLTQAKKIIADLQEQLEHKRSQADIDRLNDLEKALVDEREQRTIAQNKLNQEKALLFTQKQINLSLQKPNTNLTQRIHVYEQNLINLTNVYQTTLKDKENAEEKLTNLLTIIKTATKQFHQWQKINYYQQLKKEQGEFKAQIIQPPPWKIPK